MITSLPVILGISGSLRKDSTNTALLMAIQPAIAELVNLQIQPLINIPVYNGDLEGASLPSSVAALKSAIAQADGILICSPEYNYGVPGVLKNALDWASRPAYKSCLRGKPVLIVTSSVGPLGGVRAQSQLRDTLTATLSRIVPHPHITIGGIQHKLVDGSLEDVTLKTVMAGIRDLLAEISIASLPAER